MRSLLPDTRGVSLRTALVLFFVIGFAIALILTILVFSLSEAANRPSQATIELSQVSTGDDTYAVELSMLQPGRAAWITLVAPADHETATYASQSGDDTDHDGDGLMTDDIDNAGETVVIEGLSVGDTVTVYAGGGRSTVLRTYTVQQR